MNFNIFKKIIFILFVVFSISKLNAQMHWESMLLESETWKYLPATSEPPTNWYQPGFVDTSWSTGQGGFGFGDGDDKTNIAACNSVYLRKTITAPDLNMIQDLLLDIDYDDAFVFYINGVECARSSNVTGAFPAYNATLSVDHEAKMYAGGSPERYQLKTSSLVRGNNTFAIQIINVGLGSSDLSARVFVHAKINHSSLVYNNTPTWFVDPFTSSNLPIILINTNGQNILQNTKIMADMRVLNDSLGENYLNSTNFEFNGKVGIEIRGNTSANFPKKSYSVETRDFDSTNLNVKLLGLGKENDWVFHGPYPDKSLMRNVLAYHLGNKTGRWSPKTRYFELFVNDTYSGVYVLVEKIKNDKHRLNLADLNPIDTVGDGLTGGYIMKLDRPEATDINEKDYWISPYPAPTALQQKEFFLHVDPDGADIKPVQHEYIKNYITNFETALNSDNYTDRVNGYYSYVDLISFVDYYIINELARNLDGYRISTFMYKDKDSKGGKLTMGPYWDYDICFGNANFFSAGQTQGWIVDGMGNGDGYAMPFWWQKFRLDPIFNSYLKRRWNEMHDSFINTTYLNNLIDSCAYDLSLAQKRNFKTWNILSTYLWPNNYVGGTYENELIYLKNWLRDRISWMDSQIQPIEDITIGLINTEWRLMDLVTYPNPFVDVVNFKFNLTENSKVEILVHDVYGRVVVQYKQSLGVGIHEIPVTIPPDKQSSKIFIYQVITDGQVRTTGKLVSY